MKKGTLKILIFSAIIVAAVIAGVILLLGKGKDTKSKEQLDLGNKALVEMDYEDAILFYEEAIKLNPKNVDAYLKIAEAYVALGDYITACEYLNMGYDNTGDASIWNMLDSLQVNKYISLGDKYLSEGDPNLAKDAFDKVLERDPSNEDALGGVSDAENHPDFDPDAEVDVDKVNGGSGSGSGSGSGDGNGNAGSSDKANNNKDKNNNKKFDPYGFTFLGQPIHTDCYEGLKSASGYSGNDDIQAGLDNTAPGNGYGENITCTTDGSWKSFAITDEVVSTDPLFNSSAVVWSANSMGSQYKYMFAINPGIKYRDVAASNFDGPINIGTSLEDAIKIMGCDIDPSQIGNNTYVTKDGSSVSLYTDINYGGEGTNSIEKGLYISNDKYNLSFWFINDVVEGVNLQYN